MPCIQRRAKNEKETGEDPGKGSRDFKLYEIFGTVADCFLCYAGVYGKAQGTSPWDVFSMIHAGNFRLGGYGIGLVILLLLMAGMCTGKILLPVLLPHGSSIFPASGTAVFLPSQNERKLQKRM